MLFVLFFLFLLSIAAPPFIAYGSRRRWQFNLQAALIAIAVCSAIFAVIAMLSDNTLGRADVWLYFLRASPFVILELAWPFLISWMVTSLVLRGSLTKPQPTFLLRPDHSNHKKRNIRRSIGSYEFYPLLTAVFYVIFHKLMMAGLWIFYLHGLVDWTSENEIGLSVRLFDQTVLVLFSVYVATLTCGRLWNQQWRASLLDAPYFLVLLLLVLKFAAIP